MKINLSGSEWKLMNRLWEQSPRTITQLTAALKEQTGWTKNTVITMLSRLEAKEYYPLADRADAQRAETESFLGKVYGGRLGLMVSAMVDSRQLTEADIAELSAILKKAEGGGET